MQRQLSAFSFQLTAISFRLCGDFVGLCGFEGLCFLSRFRATFGNYEVVFGRTY